MRKSEVIKMGVLEFHVFTTQEGVLRFYNTKERVPRQNLSTKTWF